MKFTLSFKTPDALDQIEDDFEDELEKNAAIELAKKYVEYGECIRVEFDTETQSAKVLPL